MSTPSVVTWVLFCVLCFGLGLKLGLDHRGPMG